MTAYEMWMEYRDRRLSTAEGREAMRVIFTSEKHVDLSLSLRHRATGDRYRVVCLAWDDPNNRLHRTRFSWVFEDPSKQMFDDDASHRQLLMVLCVQSKVKPEWYREPNEPPTVLVPAFAVDYGPDLVVSGEGDGSHLHNIRPRDLPVGTGRTRVEEGVIVHPRVFQITHDPWEEVDNFNNRRPRRRGQDDAVQEAAR